MNNGILLLAAEGEEGRYALFAFLMSIVFVGVGLYGIFTGKLMIWGRQRWLFSLVGLDESSPGFPQLIGGCYCAVGGIVLVAMTVQAMKAPEEQQQVARPDIDLSHLPDLSKIPVHMPPGTNNPRPSSSPPVSSVPSTEAPKPRENRFDPETTERLRAERMKAEAEQEAAKREKERLAQVAKEAVEQMNREKEAARQAALELPDPPLPLSYFTYADVALQESPELGESGSERFADHAPPGGVMVGAIFFVGKNYGASIAGIQPIYQVGDKYVKGKICGDETDQPVQQLAEAGGVVAGFKLMTGRIIDAAQLAYGPLDGTKIDPKQGYFGEQIGGDGGYPGNYYAEGRAISGVFGTYEKGKSLKSLGMYVIRRMQVTGAAPPSSMSAELRTFTSSNGKFSVQAKFVALNDDGTVSLEKEDGSKVKAPLSSLSAEDQAYVNSMR
ncbi:hypothetical protein LOC68_27350 [Blastopirellula sp. JC732]|uniref:SLA1 homology domain-containing protein n=1 Tax=Blastopirellula sediminis TaxID=2894196 RepID=A0A9X1SIZ3_9BACT|nr:SHD1 domain-containing protein [Blastopirellula sediminis]MCC9604573.1 hypothetical protein [Blastopirellula sediminis]MCC9632128.1 hypothetical protein [Blastopirellula sediminis]